jgi:2-oxoglutarate ferredoxin oxidoreductase subunit alpha
MANIKSTNEFVIKFANVNGTGSASANNLFAKAVFRMGVPISAKNIFPSNIQGLRTWYEVRVSDKGYLGRRGGVDIMVCVNAESLVQDVAEVESGGYFIYDNTKPLDPRLLRKDVTFIGLPLTEICIREYTDPKQRQLFKNVLYVGALAALLDMDFTVLKNLVGDQFKGKEKLVAPNIHALELGYQYAKEHYSCPLGIRLETSKNTGDAVLIDGNEALALGAIYGGATVAAWYPITPSTSVIDGFAKYCKRLRIDPGSGKCNYAILQAEDELAAIGMAIGGNWNGARAFTATSGPGISLMSEFLGLAYFAELPVVLMNIQRSGPSTGMPTRTQQSDVMACAYASHGDSKQVCLYPATPKECFDFGADAFDLADRLQTPVIVLSDLDLGMNDNMSAPLDWDDDRAYDRGKVLNAEQLDALNERYGRYRDVDGDAIPYRTYPGTHPTKGAFFTRGTSRDEYAIYTESGEEYVKNMERLVEKWNTAKSYVPAAEITPAKSPSSGAGIIYYGTSVHATNEALDSLAKQGVALDAMRIRAFPFGNEIEEFVANHETIYVIDQNRDAQMRTLLINELEPNPAKLIALTHYDGMPVTARFIEESVQAHRAQAESNGLRDDVAS